MNSAKSWERLAAPLTNLLCICCLVGLWALMSLPNDAPNITHSPLISVSQAAPTQAKAKLPTHSTNARHALAMKELNAWAKAQPTNVDPALIYAIIRQESRFNTHARSPAGAAGLMQIMPKTAEYIIKLYRLNEMKVAALEMPKLPKPISATRLHVPQVNLTVGQHYVKYLNEKSYIDGNIIYMLTAYNAGPGNLIRWQKRFGDEISPKDFMKRISFKETRHYVQKVMANYIAYQKQFYGYSTAEQALARGEWPRI